MSGLRVQILEDPESVVEATAHTIRRRLIRSLGRTGTARLALSGGSTGTDLAHALAAGGPVGGAGDWSAVDVWQVDERVAPDGHPDRNANALSALAEVGARRAPDAGDRR